MRAAMLGRPRRRPTIGSSQRSARRTDPADWDEERDRGDCREDRVHGPCRVPIGEHPSRDTAPQQRYDPQRVPGPRLRLAEQLSRRAAEALQVFIEVNVTGEASKYGVRPADVASVVSAVGRLPNLDLAGLMTIAPAVADPEQVRPVFRELRELAAANGLIELSMGMTDDFEIAIEEGATLVRIGRAIFGERPV